MDEHGGINNGSQIHDQVEWSAFGGTTHKESILLKPKVFWW